MPFHRVRSSTLLCVVAVAACTEKVAAPPPAASRAQPLFAATATQPAVARAEPGLVQLSSGKVLVAGGVGQTGIPRAEVEEFDPATSLFALAPPLARARGAPALLAQSDGGVLALGDSTAAAAATSEERSFGVWSLAPNLSTPRARPAVTFEPPLAFGGTAAADSVEAWNGTLWQAFTLPPAGVVALAPQALPLSDTVTLVLPVEVVAGTPRAALFDATLPGFVLLGGSLPAGPLRLAPTTQARALAVGGGATALVPLDGGAASAGPTPRRARASFTASALPNGDVLVAGGEGAERFVAATASFTGAGCLAQPRTRHAALALDDGRVLLVGGVGSDGGVLASAELYDGTPARALGATCARDCECGSGSCVDGVCCNTACAGSCDVCSAALGAAADGVCTVRPAGVQCRGADGGCDAVETCDGLAAECPVDAPAAPGTSCRAAVSVCDAPEACDGVAFTCPADLAAPAGAVCRLAVGPCDVSDRCDGVQPQCPANALADAGLPCRASTGLCDLAEACDGLSAACPLDGFRPSGASCRVAAGLCDVADVCSGSSAACPDVRAAAGASCRAATGACDLGETCDGLGLDCPTDKVRDAGEGCAPAGAGLCDVPDLCDGVGKACAARVASAGVSCRAAAGPCDAVESCDGLSAACPSDARRPVGTVCLAANGACDVDDVCDGATVACAARFASAGAVCRLAAGTCDVPEVCTGSAAACPPDVLLNAGVVCRAADGGCDATEECTGASALCPPDAVALSTTLCRPAEGLCDVAARCDGATRVCPPNALRPGGAECRGSTGPCDIPEFCSGLTSACPKDFVRPSGFVCRLSRGACDLAETCNGLGGGCPTDAIAGSTVACRPAAGPCDVVERCSGGVDCPPDALSPAGTACAAYVCTGAAASCPSSCGSCASGFACVEGACVPGDGGVDAGPAEDAGVDAGTDAGEPEPVDAGEVVVDGGIYPKRYVGWSCACGATGGSPTWLLVALALMLHRRASSKRALASRATFGGSTRGNRHASAKGPLAPGATFGGFAHAPGATFGGFARALRHASSKGPFAPSATFGRSARALRVASSRAARALRSRFGDRLLRGAVLCTLLVSSNALAQSTVTDRPERSAFAIRLSAQALADMLAANFGAEVGGNVAVTHRLEVGAAASLGRYVGARAFVTLHPRDDGELLRPYVTARLLVHPVPDRVAVGGGAGLGLLIPLGRGRVTAGVLLEVYAGPAHFIPATAFASLGYEFDLYAPRPLLASAGPTVPVEVPAVTPPEPTPVPAPAPAPPVAVVVTPPPPVKPIIPDAGPVKVTFRDVIAFAPGKATLDAKAKATVARIASALRAEPRVRLLQVSGHADDGPDGGHQELGLRRAQAVLGALVESGVQSGRLTARSYGDALTLAPPSASVQARAKNRRVDFLILE